MFEIFCLHLYVLTAHSLGCRSEITRVSTVIPNQGQEYYEERYRQQVLYNLNQKAEKKGMKFVAVEPADYK